MCILFMYNGSKDEKSDYSFILISNRDEFYKRPAKNMAPWKEDDNVIGGRDLEFGYESGTWLAVSPARKKIGVLLNLPRDPKPNAISRGKVVEDFMKCALSTEEYIECLKKYSEQCNDFVFIAVELSNLTPSIKTYSNATNCLLDHDDVYVGFGNSLPQEPLKKAVYGKNKLKEICDKYNKIEFKDQLVSELLLLLKSGEKNLPDPELQMRRPNAYQYLSSVFVAIPEQAYGTRAHSIILLTKTGDMDVIEIALESPIDINNPKWVKSEYRYKIKY